ncbi:MAG: alpha-L-rhamnosidase N-terminal domain-containing protein [Tannerellaceae bacterium]|jgi:hypothetical protein|nr:alpha-L-rhamnosidase N-terminal domain-containing protein [Tannerellaceae bacterium]
MLKKVLLMALLFLSGNSVQATERMQSLLTDEWKARWITLPGAEPNGYGVYYFRKSFDLNTIPGSFPVLLSADNRYKLFVNEQLVSMGPARGDLWHWNYETIDLKSYLRAGRNVVAAVVWNEGADKAEANVSFRTGFIMQGASSEAEVLNTDDTWKCIKDKGYAPVKVVIPEYYVAGPGELLDMRQYVSGWNKTELDDSNWVLAEAIVAGTPKNRTGFAFTIGWKLQPSPLPQMELKKERLQALRSSKGVKAPKGFPISSIKVTIPAHTKVEMILDQTYLTNAYFTVQFSKGADSRIALGYQESLFNQYPSKGNRNDIEGKLFVGRKDSIISNGNEGQEFTTLSWRTYRYVLLDIETGNEPLVLDDIYGTFTGFPFERKAQFNTQDAGLNAIFDIGWRTARLCAVETYMDCPYYEQLQYLGDARIQALVSLYNSGDDRLVKNFLNLTDWSRQPEGITMSRYPTTGEQFIPPFALWYICSLHDYFMYGSDVEFVRHKLPGVRMILDYFARFQQEDGSLKDLPWWNFTDWVYVEGWDFGVALQGKDGSSALMDFQLLWAYQVAADMEKTLGMNDFAERCDGAAKKLKETIQKRYWDEARGLFSNNSDKVFFSQHANSLAILTGVVKDDAARQIAGKLLADNTLAPASVYFKYYLHQALNRAGLGNDYLNWLDIWKQNISLGLTTWAETSDLDKTRSDCHAWGSSPNIEFFRIVLGIDSEAPQFGKIKIEPHLGDIKRIGGEMPHPAGTIKVEYEVTAKGLKAHIVLPQNTSGRFVWKGKTYTLNAGENKFLL